MSYEGREQHLCQNGHRFDLGAGSMFSDELPTCPHCGSPTVFCNHVDDTNGDSWGEILPHGWESIELTPNEYETCNLGHQHLIRAATYRVPTDKELSALRHRYVEETKKWELCDV